MRFKIKKNIMQTIIKRKLNLFGHIGRMNDSRLIKDNRIWNDEWKIKKGKTSAGMVG